MKKANKVIIPNRGFSEQEQSTPTILRALSNETSFLIVFLFYSLYSWLGPVMYRSYLAYPLALWGAILFIAQIIRFKLSYIKHNIFGILFVLSYTVTISINLYRGKVLDQIQTLVWVVIFSLLIYSVSYRADRIRKNLKAIGVAFQIMTFITASISLYTYYSGMEPWYTMPDGTIALVAFLQNRLFGIYIDPNFGAFFACISLFFGFCYWLLGKRRAWSTILVTISMIVQFLYIGLSYSRTGWGCLVVEMILVMVAFTVKLYRKAKQSGKKKTFVIKTIIRVLLTVILLLAVWRPLWDLSRLDTMIQLYGPQLFPKQFESYQERQKSKKKNKKTDKEKKILEILEKSARSDTAASTRERIELAGEAIELLKASPVFGVGDRNILEASKQYIPGTKLANGKVPHNAILFLTLSGGLVALLLNLVWLIYAFIKWIRGLRKYTGEFDLELWMMGLPVILCMVAGIFLQDLYLTMSPASFFFWLFLGACVVLGDQAIRLKKVSKNKGAERS